MARKYVPVTVDEFLALIAKECKKRLKSEETEVEFRAKSATGRYDIGIIDEADFPDVIDIGFVEENFRNFVMDYDSKVSEKIRDDWSKINFDLENLMTAPRDLPDHPLIGVQTLDNGFTFVGCHCGGDWELPVFAIVYWDGKTFRGYVPEDGNTFNPKTRTAYGSEDDDEDRDEDLIENPDSIKLDKDKIIMDIKQRIVAK